MNPTWQTDDGRVKLWLGDCLDVLPTLAAGSVDAVVTDPPWNCGYFGSDDSDEWPEYRRRLNQWLEASCQCAASQVWFLSTKSLPHVSGLFDGYTAFASVKNFSQMMPTRLPNCWDIAFIKDAGRYRGTGRNWFLCNTAGMLKDRTEHPTPRSEDVMRYVIAMFDWDSVLDPFMGSGTTGVACVRLGRKFLGVEKEPKYFEIAKRRIIAELERMPLFEDKPVYRQGELVG